MVLAFSIVCKKEVFPLKNFQALALPLLIIRYESYSIIGKNQEFQMVRVERGNGKCLIFGHFLSTIQDLDS